jgi:hypothetical protein
MENFKIEITTSYGDDCAPVVKTVQYCGDVDSARREVRRLVECAYASPGVCGVNGYLENSDGCYASPNVFGVHGYLEN